MVIKYLIILYLITPDANYSLSIRKDIDFAKEFLKYHEIPEPNLCTNNHISEFCSNNREEICSARLSNNKMEFKEFENPCYMNLNNICESQDNIWTIKNSGPCVMNAQIRRFAKEIEKMAANDTNSNKTQTDYDQTEEDDKDETTTDETADDEVTAADNTTETTTVAEDENDETVADKTANDENATGDDNDESKDDTTVADETTTDESTTGDEKDENKHETIVANETATDENATGDEKDINEDKTTVADEITNEENATGNENEENNDDTNVTDDTATDENDTKDATESSKTAEDENGDTNNDETTIVEETEGITTDASETKPVNETTANDEIGKIFYDDGSVKSALREGADATTRFPPLRAEKTWDKKLCSQRVRPCPNIYFPVCLYRNKEKPNNITYYHFINSCEAQQYTCYHPERKIDGTSSMRAGFCAHIQYINYARFVHTMSAWGHYGWLHGPSPFNHILKAHERA